MKKLLVLPLLATTLLIGQLAHAVNFAQFVKERSAALAIGLGKHSYCESSVNSPEITGHNADKLVPIASVSKVFTTYFAVAKLGAFHRFETTIYVTEFNPATGAAAIHIQGSDDPYFTYDKVFFMIAELNKQGIKTLTKVTFDEGLRTFTKVREGSSPADDIDAYKFDPVTLADTQRSLTLLLNTNTWSQYSAKRAKGSVIVNGNELYKETLAAAAAKGITLPSLAAITMRAASISHLAKDSFNKAAAVKTFVMKSAPLFRYLKDMNNFSNNYIADQMARIAGGIPAMLQWYNEKLGFTSAQLKMVTGSGLDKDNDVDLAHREDNFATCEAVIKTMKALGTDLNAIVLTEAQKTYLGKANLGMMDVMPIAGVNQATYTGSGDQDSAVVFKTGTLGPGAVDNRLNIAGYARGQTDTRFFAMFFKYDNASQKVDIRSIRERIISKLLAEMGGPKPLQGYRATDKNDFMSVDKESKFELILAQPQG